MGVWGISGQAKKADSERTELYMCRVGQLQTGDGIAVAGKSFISLKLADRSGRKIIRVWTAPFLQDGHPP
jgi:hypothetical protein